MGKPIVAKQYLRSIRSEQCEIRVLKEMREDAYLSLFPPAIRYDKDKVQVSPQDVMPDRMSKICELDKEIDQRLAELDAHRAEAFRLIQKLDSDIGRTILMLYYLNSRKDGKAYTWADVSKQIQYSEDRTKHIHGKMLQQINRYLES